jgi:hypothetical protein
MIARGFTARDLHGLLRGPANFRQRNDRRTQEILERIT